jgi:trehalose synthase
VTGSVPAPSSGNVDGIRLQIRDGDNGFLVNSVDEAAERIVQVLKDARLRERLGRRAKETVRERFLMSRLIEDWIDLLAMLERRPRYLAVGGAGS